MSAHYEKYGVLLKPSPEWAVDLYGFEEDHAGDCISHMMWMACTDKTYIKFIPICAKLLKEGKRWPDGYQEDNKDRIAKTKLRYGWSKVLYKLKLIPHRLYRTQHGMTRDPYTHFFAACKINDMWDQAKDVHPPRSIYSPTFWVWQKYLHTGEDKWRRKYLRREYRGTPARQYVKDMAIVRAKSAGAYWLWVRIENLEVKPNKG